MQIYSYNCYKKANIYIKKENTDGCEEKNTSVNDYFKFIFSLFFQSHQTTFINTGVELPDAR